MTDPNTRLIADREVSAVALGGATWSFLPTMQATSAETPDEQSIATIHTAINHGITLLDTAHVYTTTDQIGHSESVIARALASHPGSGNVLVATKGGHYRHGNDQFPIDASRDTVRRHCETSLELLGIDRIWLYQLHWPDPNIPITDAMATFAELKDDGLIENVGVSNFSLPQIEEARRVVDIASLQNPFTPSDPSDRKLLQYCEDQSITYLVYSPLRKLTDGPNDSSTAALGNAFPTTARLAEERDVSIQRLLLAWMLNLSPVLIPICGASRPDSIHDSALAATVAVSAEDARTIERELQ